MRFGEKMGCLEQTQYNIISIERDAGLWIIFLALDILPSDQTWDIPHLCTIFLLN
jgi:hypothetical protein